MEGAFVCLPAKSAKDTRHCEIRVKKIEFAKTSLEEGDLAPVIYRTYHHQTTEVGVRIPVEVLDELSWLLKTFNISVGVTQTPFYRLDAYFNNERLHILEINACFVDGWGTALNLARAGGVQINPNYLRHFPKLFSLANEDYLPELELFLIELDNLGLKGGEIIDWETAINGEQLVYLYGRNGRRVASNLLPHDGLRIDNKMRLAKLSRSWEGERVLIPRHYFVEQNDWEDIPIEVVLKFCDKSSPECQRARHSVLFGKPGGKARFLKRCFREGKLIAQDAVIPAQHDGKNCQLVILVIGDQVVTGYTQYSTARMINDNSTHGPLLIG